jgi:hypothetical protein
MPKDKDPLSKLLEYREHKRILENLSRLLADKVLKRTVSNVGGGTSGVFSWSEKKLALFLYSNGTYRFETTEFRSVSGGGYSIPSESKRAFEGTWLVEIIEDKPALVIRQDETIINWWHAENGGAGIQYLNGVRWGRYAL